MLAAGLSVAYCGAPLASISHVMRLIHFLISRTSLYFCSTSSTTIFNKKIIIIIFIFRTKSADTLPFYLILMTTIGIYTVFVIILIFFCYFFLRGFTTYPRNPRNVWVCTVYCVLCTVYCVLCTVYTFHRYLGPAGFL